MASGVHIGPLHDVDRDGARLRARRVCSTFSMIQAERAVRGGQRHVNGHVIVVVHLDAVYQPQVHDVLEDLRVDHRFEVFATKFGRRNASALLISLPQLSSRQLAAAAKTNRFRKVRPSLQDACSRLAGPLVVRRLLQCFDHHAVRRLSGQRPPAARQIPGGVSSIQTHAPAAEFLQRGCDVFHLVADMARSPGISAAVPLLRRSARSVRACCCRRPEMRRLDGRLGRRAASKSVAMPSASQKVLRLSVDVVHHDAHVVEPFEHVTPNFLPVRIRRRRGARRHDLSPGCEPSTEPTKSGISASSGRRGVLSAASTLCTRSLSRVARTLQAGRLFGGAHALVRAATRRQRPRPSGSDSRRPRP